MSAPERKPRKYQVIWERLKVDKKVTVTIKCAATCTLEQITADFNTIRKAVKNEKYADWPFKMRYPEAELESILVVPEKKLLELGELPSAIIKLTLDRNDVSGLF
jgi:hypothetical protein